MKYLVLLPYVALLLVVVSIFVVSVADEFWDRIFRRKHKDG